MPVPCKEGRAPGRGAPEASAARDALGRRRSDADERDALPRGSEGEARPTEGARQCLAALLKESLDEISGLLFCMRARSPWLTIREAERYAHAPHGEIGKAVRDGELPAYQRSSNTVTLVDVEEVNEWIRDRWRVRYVDGRPRRAR